MNTSKYSDAGKILCRPYRDDYYECLHHTKEVSSVESYRLWWWMGLRGGSVGGLIGRDGMGGYWIQGSGWTWMRYMD